MELRRTISTAIDSRLFRNAFGTEAMRAVFDERALVARYIEVEVALAVAEASCGVIPPEAAATIKREARVELIDFDRLGDETDIVGYPILPLVRQLAALSGEAGRHIHWGATTQDIMDTATVLQVRAALDLIDNDVRALRTILAGLAQRYRDTPMAGRTHLQHALPITFGLKAAVWLSMLDRHQTRLAELRPRVEVVQFAGAAGTLAALDDDGLAVHAALAKELNLGSASAPWHVARDSFVETLNLLALITGSLAKIAVDVMLMASTEFGELSEPFVDGRGASSTMPQKRNPISSELILAAAKAVRQHSGLMQDAAVQDFERATGPWHAEWLAIPESFILTAGALHQARFALGGLIVDEARMRANLDLTDGLIVAEAVMMQLAPSLGREAAHDLVYAACRSARDEGCGLAAALGKIPEVARRFDHDALESITDPTYYLGMSASIVDRALAASAAL